MARPRTPAFGSRLYLALSPTATLTFAGGFAGLARTGALSASVGDLRIEMLSLRMFAALYCWLPGPPSWTIAPGE